MVDLKIAIVDGTFHEVDSSELAFKMAGIFAFKDACKKAAPILLEPVMKVEVTTPDEYQGDLLGDLNRRRGKITGIEIKSGGTSLNAEVPLSEMFGYATAIRSFRKDGRPIPWNRSVLSRYRAALPRPSLIRPTRSRRAVKLGFETIVLLWLDNGFASD